MLKTKLTNIHHFELKYFLHLDTFSVHDALQLKQVTDTYVY